MTATEAMERTTAAGDGNANKTQSAERAEGSAAEAKAAGAAAATTASSAGRDQRPSATGGTADEARKKKRRKVNHGEYLGSELTLPFACVASVVKHISFSLARVRFSP